MSTAEDNQYFHARGLQEREKAALAVQADVAAVHLELARQYEARIQDNDVMPNSLSNTGNVPANGPRT